MSSLFYEVHHANSPEEGDVMEIDPDIRILEGGANVGRSGIASRTHSCTRPTVIAPTAAQEPVRRSSRSLGSSATRSRVLPRGAETLLVWGDDTATTHAAGSVAHSCTRSCATAPTCMSHSGRSSTSRYPPDGAHLRGLEGALVRDHRRVTAERRVLSHRRVDVEFGRAASASSTTSSTPPSDRRRASELRELSGGTQARGNWCLTPKSDTYSHLQLPEAQGSVVAEEQLTGARTGQMFVSAERRPRPPDRGRLTQLSQPEKLKAKRKASVTDSDFVSQ